jgi:hypothetical protein
LRMIIQQLTGSHARPSLAASVSAAGLASRACCSLCSRVAKALLAISARRLHQQDPPRHPVAPPPPSSRRVTVAARDEPGSSKPSRRRPPAGSLSCRRPRRAACRAHAAQS